MKKLLAMMLVSVMIFSSLVAFAAPVPIDVPADLQVSGNGTTFVDRLQVKLGDQVSFRASLNMKPVREQFEKDYKEILDLYENFSGESRTSLVEKLHSCLVTGAWTLTLTYPNVLTMPASVTGGSNMDGFNNNAKLVFEEVSRSLTFGEANDTFVIKVKVKEGITVGDLESNLANALGDMTFTGNGVVATAAQDCLLVGTITGTTAIERYSRKQEYTFTGIDPVASVPEVTAELYVAQSGSQVVPPVPGLPDYFDGGDEVADPKETGVADVLNTEQHIVYLEGYPDGTIRPEANVTRAEATTMLYRLLRPEIREEIFTLENGFGDVEKTLWYNKAVSSMAKGGYVNGYEDGNFYGDNEITRAELVTIVARFAKAKESQVPFSDVDDSHWAYGYISTAVANKWIDGYEDGSFKPEQPITRAETATIINRVLSRGVKSYGVVEGIKKWPDNPENEWYYYEMVEATNEHTYTNTRPSEIWKNLYIDYEYDIVHYERP